MSECGSVKFAADLQNLEELVCTIANAKQYPKETTDMGMRLLAMRIQLAILKELEQLNKQLNAAGSFIEDIAEKTEDIPQIMADIESLRRKDQGRP
jgi:hypothetical protein